MEMSLTKHTRMQHSLFIVSPLHGIKNHSGDCVTHKRSSLKEVWLAFTIQGYKPSKIEMILMMHTKTQQYLFMLSPCMKCENHFREETHTSIKELHVKHPETDQSFRGATTRRCDEIISKSPTSSFKQLF